MSLRPRWIRCLCLGATLTAGAVDAQTPRYSPKEIGQIVDAALNAVIPPEERLTSHTVAERGIRFDYGRTLAAFGSVDRPELRAQLALTRALAEGSTALLEDCDQRGTKSCSRLGRAAYVYVEPVSVSTSEAVVWVHVEWATTPSKRSYRSSASTEVILTRTGAGPWRFARVGRGIVS